MYQTAKAMKLIFFLATVLMTTISFAQQDPTQPAYKRYPTIPGLQLLSLDSTAYTKEQLPRKKQVLIMLFSPDCDHCQHETEQIVANKEAFADTHILMVSTLPLFRLKEFEKQYGLEQMQNVTITKDPYYVLISFYSLRMFPFMALYNRKGDLIQTYQGSVGVEKILATFKENQ